MGQMFLVAGLQDSPLIVLGKDWCTWPDWDKIEVVLLVCY